MLAHSTPLSRCSSPPAVVSLAFRKAGTLCNLQSWWFLALSDRPEWLVIKPDRYSSSIIAAYLLTNFPPGLFRYRQGPTVIILTTAAGSYVTAWGSLILLPPRHLSYIVRMCLWNQDVVFCVLGLCISKNCDWLGEKPSFLYYCKPGQTHTYPHNGLSRVMVQPFFYVS